MRRLPKGIGEGLHFIWQHPLVRWMTLLGFGNSVTSGGITGLAVVYAITTFGLAENDGRLGLLYTAGAAGTLTITLLLPRLLRRVPVGWITLAGLSATPLMVAGLVLAPNLVVGCVFYLLWSMYFVLVVQNGITYRQTVTPDELLSRVNTTARMIAWGGTPFGAILGGTITSFSEVGLDYLIMAVGVAISAILGWLSPLRQRKLLINHPNK